MQRSANDDPPPYDKLCRENQQVRVASVSQRPLHDDVLASFDGQAYQNRSGNGAQICYVQNPGTLGASDGQYFQTSGPVYFQPYDQNSPWISGHYASEGQNYRAPGPAYFQSNDRNSTRMPGFYGAAAQSSAYGVAPAAAYHHLQGDARPSFYGGGYQNRGCYRIESPYARNPGTVYGAKEGQYDQTPKTAYSQPYERDSPQSSGYYEAQGPAFGESSSARGKLHQASNEKSDRYSDQIGFIDDAGGISRDLNNPVRGFTDHTFGTVSHEDLLDASDDDASLAEALHLHVHSPPSYDTVPQLRMPIAVPQMMSGTGVPFSRAYSSELESHGISCEEFLEFVDKLNVVSTANPPLQVLDLVGGVLGMVPHSWAQIAGAATQAVAKIGIYAVSKGRTDRFMKQANSELFGPRRLKVQLCTTSALGKILGLPADEPFFAPLSDLNKDQPVNERRLAALEGYISPLIFQVPPPSPQSSALARLSEKQVKRQLKKSENKLVKDRKKALKQMPGENPKSLREYEKEMRKLNNEIDKVNRKAEKEIAKKSKEREKDERKWIKEVEKARKELEKELRKIDKEMDKLGRETEKERSKERKDYEKEDKEIKSFKKILWIVVVNLE
ncbi:hypothetical protein V1517DRAFT_321697 [Lipomyces orientalis]|uniref:Uncharacterized protein n=1 Tax=Lipomyces orientalis TaxID=1233043 RepID=A0ACC3TPI1_9ASCO